jgi:YD repeat-containing protein
MSDRVGRTLSFTYDAKGRLSTMTDPASGLFQYGYDDPQNRLSSVTYPDGMVRTYQYNEAAYLTSPWVCTNGLPWALTGISDNGQRFKTYRYDCNGTTAIGTELAGGINKFSYTGSQTEVDPLGTTRNQPGHDDLSGERAGAEG